jgi:glycosyltransferase involved in cell wall biosynthesis
MSGSKQGGSTQKETPMQTAQRGARFERAFPDSPQSASDKYRPRLLIFIVAYNAASTINDVLARIPSSIGDDYDVELLVIDDASTDETFERVRARLGETRLPFPLTLLYNPENQGYGGNQKIGYHYAIKNGFHFVALVHGDGQYAPECLPDLVRPLKNGEADAVFGSRMMTRGAALAGGMPRYKFVGNKILSWFENRMLRLSLSEFHSGYRVYSVSALKQIPFALNTNDFHFDTEIIIQFQLAGLRIAERPIPTYYGDEICYVNGVKYAIDVSKAVVKARAQEIGLFYDPRFDCGGPDRTNSQYGAKLGYESPHSITVAKVPPGSRVLDLGCAGGYMGVALRDRRQCRVTGVDYFPLEPGVELDAFYQADLNAGLPDVRWEEYDCILMLDVIEHLLAPEKFVENLRDRLSMAPNVTLLVSTANIAFIVTRLMLLFGQFNYGKRGILDATHTRLFTIATFRRLFEQSGFEVVEVKGVPAPFALAVGEGPVGKLLMGLNKLLITFARGLFSYQMYMVVKPTPSLDYLLRHAEEQSAIRADLPTSP